MTSFWPIVILVGIVGTLTGAATALRSVSRIWLRHWAERRLAGAGTATLYLERPQRLLLAAGTGIAGTVFALGAVIGLQHGDNGAALTKNVVVAGAILLLVGQLVPRAIARRWPGEALPLLLPPLRVVERLTAPLAHTATRIVRRLRGAPVVAAPTAHESLEDLLREGEVEGFGAADERAIISGVVEFGATRVGTVMTPRSEMVAVERRAPADQVARVVADSHYSRLPIYEGTLDRVIGMLTSWDVIAHPEAPLRAPRPVAVASPDEPCHSLMTRMLRERRHLAIVRGASGDTVGLVTLEDLVEEIVGEIQDEHDDPTADR
ncbi:MAG: CNNM domain-containing protein [Gemmatimonadaceae bacterium]